MLINSAIDDSAGFPLELMRLSSKLEASKASERSHDVVDHSSLDAGHYAAPMMELPERDLSAMAKLFDRQDAEDIEAEICKLLVWLSPAPYWEEEFEFLKEYL